MSSLYDERDDIFDINVAPKILNIFTGDTFTANLYLTIPATTIDKIVLNSELLPSSVELTIVSSTSTTSTWLLTLTKTQTIILPAKQAAFTITILYTDTTELTLYQGLMIVNNKVFSTHPYFTPILANRAPLATDNIYTLGSLWIDTALSTVYYLTAIIDNEATWAEQNISVKVVTDVADIKSGAVAVGKAIADDEGNDINDTYLKKNISLLSNLDALSGTDTIVIGNDELATKITVTDLKNYIFAQTSDITTMFENNQHLSIGAVEEPELTNNGSGNITVADISVNMYKTNNKTGLIYQYEISGITETLTDGVVNYIVAKYNSGTPILDIITDRSLITFSDVVPIFTISRIGNDIHVLNLDELGNGLLEKMLDKQLCVSRFCRVSGLIPSITGTLNIKLTEGEAYYGYIKLSLEEVLSAIDTCYFYYHSSGTWTYSLVTQFNNTQYDNGTNLVNLTANRYAVIWIFRGIEDNKVMYIVQGTGNYTKTDALNSSVPSLPTIITEHALLTGRFIVQTSATSGIEQNAFDTTFNYAEVTSHSDLTGRDLETAHDVVTTIKSGFMSYADKIILNELNARVINIHTLEDPMGSMQDIYDGLVLVGYPEELHTMTFAFALVCYNYTGRFYELFYDFTYNTVDYVFRAIKTKNENITVFAEDKTWICTGYDELTLEIYLAEASAGVELVVSDNA